MESTSVSATKVGIFFLIGMAILAVLTFRIERFSEWWNYYDLIAHFDQAKSLEAKNDVTLAGTKVGYVKSVSVDGDKIKVVLSIEKGIDIRKGSEASIISDFLLGKSHVNITLAPTSNPAYNAGEVIKTVESPNFTDMVSKLDNALTGLQNITEPLEDIKELVNSLKVAGKSLEEAGPKFSKLIDSALNITEKIERGEGSLTKIITNDELYVELEKLINDARQTIQAYREQIPVGAFGSIVFSAF